MLAFIESFIQNSSRLIQLKSRSPIIFCVGCARTFVPNIIRYHSCYCSTLLDYNFLFTGEQPSGETESPKKKKIKESGEGDETEKEGNEKSNSGIQSLVFRQCLILKENVTLIANFFTHKNCRCFFVHPLFVQLCYFFFVFLENVPKGWSLRRIFAKRE